METKEMIETLRYNNKRFLTEPDLIFEVADRLEELEEYKRMYENLCR